MGKWVWPILGGGGKGGTPFGKAGPMWSSGRHTGTDFPVPTGTGVLAVAAGRITFAGDTGGAYGKQIKIQHRPGFESWYCHLSSIGAAFTRGMQVVGGDIIGKVGSTGNTTGPHLHLEARVNGSAVDPMPYLTGAKDPGKSSSGPNLGDIPKSDGPNPKGNGTNHHGGTQTVGVGIPGIDLADQVKQFVLVSAALGCGVALVLIGVARTMKPVRDSLPGGGSVKDKAALAANFIPQAKAATAVAGAAKGVGK